MQSPAKIFIGGNIPAWLTGPLRDQIRGYGQFGTGWDGPVFQPTCNEHLIDKLTPKGRLGLYDKFAVEGQFKSLESFLKTHGIYFDRYNDGLLMQFRGGDPIATQLCKHDTPAVNGNSLLAVKGMMLKAEEEHRKGRLSTAMHMFQTARHELQQLLPQTVVDLEPFKIVGGSTPKPKPRDVVVIQVSQGQVSCVYCDDPHTPVMIVDWDKRGHGVPPIAIHPDRALLSEALSSVRAAVEAAESL